MSDSAILEKPNLLAKPEGIPKIENEQREDREAFFGSVIKEVNDQLKMINETAEEDGWGKLEYTSEIESADHDLRRAFKKSMAVQESMSALLTMNNMLANEFFIQEHPKDKKYPGKTRDAIQNALVYQADWQQKVANFLVGHMGHTLNAKSEDGVHQQFLAARDKNIKDARHVLEPVFGIKLAQSQIKDMVEKQWQSAVGMAAAAHLLNSMSLDVRWADAKHDVENKIDFLVTTKDGKEFAIQLKTLSKLKKSDLLLPKNYAEYKDPRMQYELISIRDGVDRYNSQEGKQAVPVMLLIRFNSDELDTTTGFMNASTRKTLKDKLVEALGAGVFVEPKKEE